MSILDDAIREHLELKRAHGADEAEVKRLEDEAFGPPGRPEEPDPLAEAPTAFMATPEAEAASEAPDAEGRRINIADLQEPPPPEAAEEGKPLVPAEDAIQAAAPAEEEPAAEHEAIAEAPDAEASSPSDEEIPDVEAAEPKLAPLEPPTEIHASRAEAPADLPEEEEEDEEFWSEQRLSDELDQALEAPLEEDEEPLAEAPRAEEPISEEYERPEAQAEPAADPAGPAEPEQQVDYDPDTGHEDELWFEQKPPKDFDFDD